MFNLVFAVCGALVGALGVVLWHAFKSLQLEVRSIVVTLNSDFVRKDDYRDDIKNVQDTLNWIRDKLDGKADKD